MTYSLIHLFSQLIISSAFLCSCVLTSSKTPNIQVVNDYKKYLIIEKYSVIDVVACLIVNLLFVNSISYFEYGHVFLKFSNMDIEIERFYVILFECICFPT